jgi:obg-like ATPase 1
MRAFEDDDIIHAEDTVDPVRDVNTIMNELRIKDASFLESKRGQHKKTETQAKSKGGQFKKRWDEELDLMDRLIQWLEDGKDVRNGMDQWSTKDIEFLNDYGLITAKPCMFAVNLNTKDFARKKNKFLKPIFEWVQANAPGSAIIPFCAGYEEELKDMPPEQAAETLKADELTSAMPRIISTGFHMVHLQYFFTAGADEVRAWTIRRGSKAPQAAGAIHSDFERGFICAEVMAFDDLKALGSEAEVKAAGKWRQEGKTYEVVDGDVINFKFNVTTAPKK